jgi:type I restriction enzyme R subunit
MPKESTIEEQLWNTANKLRGKVESSEYKHVVLGLIFLKFASDKFARRRQELIDEGKEKYTFEGKVYDDMAESLTDMILAIKAAYSEWEKLGIIFDEKAFYDILKELAHKYDFQYPEDKLITLSQKVKVAVDDKAKYTDRSKRDDIKAELKVDLILLLGEYDYPPVDRDEVYQEIFKQAENYKKNRG